MTEFAGRWRSILSSLDVRAVLAVDSRRPALQIGEQEPSQSIQKWVYITLRANIIRLRIPPACPISENEISDALSTIRTPVREAFIRLAEEGLLRITPQKRTIVSPIDLRQAEEARFLRCAVEKAVLKEACGALDGATRCRLRASIEKQEMCRAAGALEQLLIEDDEFHRAIFRAFRKEQSWLYIQKLDCNFDRLRFVALPRSTADLVSEHRRILGAITQGRIERIDALVDEHMSLREMHRAIGDCPPEYFEGAPAGARPPQAVDALAVIYFLTTMVCLLVALRFVSPTQMVFKIK